MQQLRQLNLQQNALRQIVTSKLPNTALKFLDISYNKLTNVEAVQYLLGLQTLRM